VAKKGYAVTSGPVEGNEIGRRRFPPSPPCRIAFKHFVEFADGAGVRYLDEVTPRVMEDLLEHLAPRPLAPRKLPTVFPPHPRKWMPGV